MNKLYLLVIFIACTSCYAIGQDSTAVKSKIDLYAGIFKDPLHGKPMIDFESVLLNGEKIRLSDHKGKVILLNFWFIGCPPCMGEIPDINQVYKAYKDSSVVILSLAKNSVSELKEFEEGKYIRPIEAIQYPVIPDCEQIANLYHVTGYPRTVLIDKQGNIRLIYAGATMASLRKYVQYYGDKNLSKEWKKILEANTDKHPEMSEIFSALISELLRE